MKTEMANVKAESDPQSLLCENLSRSLHAMAQPITVLRGAIGAMVMRRDSGADAGRYLDLSHQQVERLCNLLSEMRDLVDSVQSPQLEASSPSDSLQEVN